MSIMKTELKVPVNCEKCKTAILKEVSKLTGVDSVTIDAEKGILTVLGTVDPVCIAKNLRKAKIFAQITSVGPPKKPEPAKSPEKSKPCKPLPPCCNDCQLVAVSYVTYGYDGGVCSIL